MTPTAWVFLIVAVVAIIVAAFFALRARTKKLRTKFGPEYDRTVREQGSTVKAERELEHREKRIHGLHIHPLSSEESDNFAHEWRAVQERFVDDPRSAVADADRLVHRTMQARGYPIAREFEDRAADLSVEHATVVEHYRVAHEIAGRDGRNAASTEDLRLAMKHYRALFEDLLGRHIEEFTEVRR
jgi:FtsZ-interacting cell division protein ZipA